MSVVMLIVILLSFEIAISSFVIDFLFEGVVLSTTCSDFSTFISAGENVVDRSVNLSRTSEINKI